MGDDETAVRAVVDDYVVGWFDGDAGRMERALHPELVKRCRGIEGDPDALETLTAGDTIDAMGEGMGRREDAHLIRMPDGWRIINAAWRLR